MLNMQFTKIKNVLFARVEGELSVNTINEFETILKHELIHYPPIVAFDCNELSHVDSTGLNHLIKLARIAREHDAKIFYIDVKPVIMQMFSFTNLGTNSTIMTMDAFEADYLSMPID